MSKGVAIVLALFAGGVVGFQPPANAALGHHVSDLGAAFVSIVISLVLLTFVLLVFGHPTRLSGLGSIRPQDTLGGIGGAIVVAIGLVAVRPLGAAAVIALLVAGQLVTSVLTDRFGWFGVPPVGISAGRTVGLLLVLGGTVLVTRS